MAEGVKSGESDCLRSKAAITWALDEATAGRLDGEAFINYCMPRALCVELPHGGGIVFCSPWHPKYRPMDPPKAGLPRSRDVMWDRQAQHSKHLILEMEGPDREQSWALDCATEYTNVRLVGIGQYEILSERLRTQTLAWLRHHPNWVRTPHDGPANEKRLLRVPLEEWNAVFGDLRRPAKEKKT